MIDFKNYQPTKKEWDKIHKKAQQMYFKKIEKYPQFIRFEDILINDHVNHLVKKLRKKKEDEYFEGLWLIEEEKRQKERRASSYKNIQEINVENSNSNRLLLTLSIIFIVFVLIVFLL